MHTTYKGALKLSYIVAQTYDDKLNLTFLVYRQEVIEFWTQKPNKWYHINIIN